MADFDFRGLDVCTATIAATKTFQLDPATRYVAELSGADGGASAVDLKYQLGDGATATEYPDNPGVIGSGLEILTPVKGVVQVAITGGAAVAVQVHFRKIGK